MSRSIKRTLNDPTTKEPPIEISPEADAAMAELVKIFSDPNLPTKPRFRCGVEGPDEFDVLFELIVDDQNTNVGSDAYTTSA